MPLLANVLLSTSRSTFTASAYGGTTGTPTPHLSGIPANIQPMNATQYGLLPPGALNIGYVADVDSGTDIAPDDLITSAVLLSDGVTPWPGFSSAATWTVRFILESGPMLMPSRLCFIDMTITGGTSN